MRKLVNGVAFELTPEEVAAREAEQAAYVPPAPGPFVLPLTHFWLNMTETEAADFDAALVVANPIRLRRALGRATEMSSDGELYTFALTILGTVVTTERALEIMARPDPGFVPMADPLAEDAGPGLVGDPA